MNFIKKLINKYKSFLKDLELIKEKQTQVKLFKERQTVQEHR